MSQHLAHRLRQSVREGTQIEYSPEKQEIADLVEQYRLAVEQKRRGCPTDPRKSQVLRECEYHHRSNGRLRL